MLFFKRYLERSQQVADNFESSQIPCYIKMRDLPAPPVVDHCRDLILTSCALRFMPYTEDWIVVEYFADHDSDYLVSVSPCRRYAFLSLEPSTPPTNPIAPQMCVNVVPPILDYKSSGSVK